MTRICEKCGSPFDDRVLLDGTRFNLHGRKFCLVCRPHRPQRKPRKRVIRAITRKSCDACGNPFAVRQIIAGRLRYLYRRRFCFDCSPFGTHNTSKHPPAIGIPEDLREYRRKRRNAKTYRYQKRRRLEWKIELIAARGGKCADCGYSACPAAFEFHHRDPTTKEFTLSRFNGSRARRDAEIAKCDMLCANCHRIRHISMQPALVAGHEVRRRRERKSRVVVLMGGRCHGCYRDGPLQLFELHHLDAARKDFGISEDGIMRRWERVVGELTKCVMLCANCHREVHAGIREIDDGLLGLAEDSGHYSRKIA